MERFEFVCNLGEGAYGTVWKCRDRETERMVAMKRFKDAHVDEEVMRLALREIRILKGAHHPNIVKMLEAFRSKSGRVYLVMEFVEHTLTEELRRNPRGFAPDHVKLVTWQLLQATAHLHKTRVIHRDLKPANILLNPNGEVKICDFGFARNMVSKETAEYTSYVVTRWYRPPEILVGDAYGPAVDVWAIGCLFAEMVTGRPLFPGRNTLDQLWLTVRTLGRLTDRQTALMMRDPKLCTINVPPPEELHSLSRRFPAFTPSMMQVLRACLDPDPAQRLTAAQVMQLPYFFDIHKVIARNEAAQVKATSPPSPCMSDASPPPTLFASNSNTCSRGSSMDSGLSSSGPLHSKASAPLAKPAVLPPAVVVAAAVEAAVAAQATSAAQSTSASVSDSASPIAPVVSYSTAPQACQRQPSNLSSSSCLRPLSEASNSVNHSLASIDLRQAIQALQRAELTSLKEQQSVHRSASLGVAPPMYTPDAPAKQYTGIPSASHTKFGHSGPVLMHKQPVLTPLPSLATEGKVGQTSGPMVVVDARGSNLSRMTSALSPVGSTASKPARIVSMPGHLHPSHESTGSPVSHPPALCSRSSCGLAVEEEEELQEARSKSMEATAAFMARDQQEMNAQRRRSFGQAVRALGARLEALVHRPFAAGGNLQ